MEVPMGWFRISIARMLMIVAYCGLGFAAVRSPSWICASVVFSLIVASLAVARLTAVYRLGARRAFWTGFAFCGWLYLGLSTQGWNGSSPSPLIVTTPLMDLAYPSIVGISAPPPTPAAGVMMGMMRGRMMGMGGMMGGGGMGGPGVSTQGIWEYWSEPPQAAGQFSWLVPEPFRVICHSMLAPIVALLGGLLASRLHRTREE